MSISKVHDLLQNKGCVWTVSILMVLGVVFTSFAQCSNSERMNEMGRSNDPGSVIASLQGHSITERLYEGQLRQSSQIYGGLDVLPVDSQVQIQAGTLRSLIGQILLIDLAKKYNIEMSDADVEKKVKEDIEATMAQIRQQFVAQGKLKQESTDAEFAALFKQQEGRDLEAVKEGIFNENMSVLRNANDLRIPVAGGVLSQPVMDAMKKELKLSDEEIKKTYDSYQFKRITLRKGLPEQTAEKILTELKNGMTFEQAIDRYSDAPPPADAKQKARDLIEPMSITTIRGFTPYAPLEKLKAGEVSKPITIGETVNLFKLISIKSDVPKDFDKKKDTYRDTQLTSLAASKLQSELQTLQEAAKIEWKMPIYKSLYDYGRLMAESMSSEERNKSIRAIMESAMKESEEGDDRTNGIATTLAFVAFQKVYENAPAAEKKDLEADKIAIYEKYLASREDTEMRLELVELYKKAKNGEGFFTELKNAADSNISAVDNTGQSVFSRINKLIMEGEEAKLLTADQVKQLQESQELWKQQKAEDDKYQAQLKKEQEEATKKLEEEAKKAKKEALEKVQTREEHSKKPQPKTGGAK